MRIVYYTHTAFFETALSLVQELSERVELHLVLELAPDAWQTAAFQLPRRDLPSGLVPADPVLRDAFPASVRKHWERTASFHLAVHNQPRSLHPASWRVSREVIRFAAGLSPAALHVDDVDVSPRLALGLPHLGKVPLVLSAHDPEPHSGERNWRKDLARRIAYRLARRIVLHSAALQVGFRERYRLAAERVAVVPLGVGELSRAWGEAPVPERFPTVLFFGRISPYKGLGVLYAALPRVAAAVPALRTVVAGRAVAGYDPPLPPALPSPAAVEVIDRYLGNSEIAALLQEATVVVCPYLDATQSGVVLTAYAFGTPVIASAIGGLPEYVTDGETGLLVPADDAPALAAAMVRMLEDAGLRARLREGIARAREGRLSWGRAADRLVSIYEAVAR